LALTSNAIASAVNTPKMTVTHETMMSHCAICCTIPEIAELRKDFPGEASIRPGDPAVPRMLLRRLRCPSRRKALLPSTVSDQDRPDIPAFWYGALSDSKHNSTIPAALLLESDCA
jgi:hypothetical protein